MALELEGTLAQKLPVQSGNSARGPWAKQEFILEYPDGNFTAKACFTAWGQDKVQDLGKYQVGDKVKVSFNLKSREYNGRWYNDLPPPRSSSPPRRRSPRRRPLPGSRLRLPPSRTCPPIPKERKTFRSRNADPWHTGAGPKWAGSLFCAPSFSFFEKNRWIIKNYYLY